MELQVGQTYLARSGYRVTITGKDDQNLHFEGQLGDTPLTWDIGGCYLPTGEPHPWDLVAAVTLSF